MITALPEGLGRPWGVPLRLWHDTRSLGLRTGKAEEAAMRPDLPGPILKGWTFPGTESKRHGDIYGATVVLFLGGSAATSSR